MTTTTPGAHQETTTGAASPVRESAQRERPPSRRWAVLATALGALVAAVALFGLVFPQLLAPAVAIAVLGAVVGLQWLLPGELPHTRPTHWTF
jgi:fatty acid desaturase